jgi:ElaB/YqjD/DUF883 family membrane-anchored ribosome-binding protein
MNVNPAANETTGPAPNGAGSSEINNLIADIEDVLAKAGHVVDLNVPKLRESLRRKLAMAKFGITEGGRRVSAAARTAATATDEYVHQSPWQAIGIAAAVGATVGFLLARRR